jgi:hypothetical protein
MPAWVRDTLLVAAVIVALIGVPLLIVIWANRNKP